VFTLLALLSGEGRAHHGEILREAARLVEAGALRPELVAQRFQLADADAAYRSIQAGDPGRAGDRQDRDRPDRVVASRGTAKPAKNVGPGRAAALRGAISGPNCEATRSARSL